MLLDADCAASQAAEYHRLIAGPPAAPTAATAAAGLVSNNQQASPRKKLDVSRHSASCSVLARQQRSGRTPNKAGCDQLVTFTHCASCSVLLLFPTRWHPERKLVGNSSCTSCGPILLCFFLLAGRGHEPHDDPVDAGRDKQRRHDGGGDHGAQPEGAAARLSLLSDFCLCRRPGVGLGVVLLVAHGALSGSLGSCLLRGDRVVVGSFKRTPGSELICSGTQWGSGGRRSECKNEGMLVSMECAVEGCAERGAVPTLDAYLEP